MVLQALHLLYNTLKSQRKIASEGLRGRFGFEKVAYLPSRSTNFLPKLRSRSIFVPVRSPGGDRRADRRSFEPRRFGRRDRGARGLTAKRSRPEMAPQRLEKIESAPGNGMGSEASNPQDLVHGRAADRARLRLTSRKNDKVAKLQKKAPNALKSLDAELKSAPAFPSSERCGEFIRTHRSAFLIVMIRSASSGQSRSSELSAER